MGSYLDDLALFTFNYGPTWARRVMFDRMVRGDPGLVDAIVPAALRHPDVDVRLAALEALAASLRWEHLHLVRVAQHDSHEAVRAAAAQVMGQYRSIRVGRHLLPALQDPHPRVRAAAARSLGRVPALRFSAALENALADEDSEVRACAAWALGRVGRAEALVPLRAMAAREPIYANRRLARQAIAGIERRTASRGEKRRQAMSELTQTLLDQLRSWDERERAKACLVRIGDDNLIPELERALEATNDVQVHFHIVDILARLPPCRELQIALIGCLRHISPPVRRRATEALGNMGDAEAIYYLLDVAPQAYPLTEKDASLVYEAVRRIEERSRKGYSLDRATEAVQ